MKKGDQVRIIAGKDKGKTGKVMTTIAREDKIVVEGLNMVKRNRKPRKQGAKGQIVEMPSPLSVSNAMIVCPSCNKPARIGYSVTENRKDRVCKKCGAKF